MATTAATLEILVNARTAQATSSLRRMDASTKQSATHLSNLDRTTGRLSGTFSRVAKTAVAAGGAYLSLQAAKDAFSATTDLAKATINLNQNLGFTTKTAIELSTQLKVRGADAKQSSMAFKTFAGVLNSAGTGSASAADQLAQLGITGKKLKDDLKDPQKALFDVADGLKELGPGAARTALQGKLFGRGWAALSPILRGGSKDLKDQLAAAKPVADAFGKDGVKGIKDYIQSQREMQIEILALQVSFAKNLAPVLIKIFNAFGDIIHGGFVKWLINAGGWVRNAAKDFAHWISTTGTLAEHFKAFIKIVVELGKFMFSVGKAFVTAAKWAVNAGGDIVGAFKNAYHWIKNAWQDVGDFISKPFGKAVGVVTGFINDIIDVINTVLGPVGVHIGNVGGGGGGGGGGGVQTTKHKGKGTHANSGGHQQGGVIVPGQGSGDKIPAMLEPGEFVLNREAVRAVGVGKLDKTNRQFPRFQDGGVIRLARGGLSSTSPGSVGKSHPGTSGGLPGLGDFPDWLKPAGQFVLDKVGGFIKSKLASIVPGVGGDVLNTKSGAATLKALQSSHPELQPGITQVLAAVLANNGGLSITSTTGGSHVAGSYHYLGRAVDIAGSSGAMSSASNWIKRSGLYKTLTEGIHNPNLAVANGHIYSGAGPFGAVWAGHTNHIHLAKQRGGVVNGHDLYKEFWPFDNWAIKDGMASRFPGRPSQTAWLTMLGEYAQHQRLNPGKMARLHGDRKKDPGKWWNKWVAGGASIFLQGGGRVPNPKHGAHWIKDLGSHIDANEAATLLWQAGLSEADAGALSRVVPGESGGNPRAKNASGATGLFQILGSVFPGNLYDPRINAINAAIKWRTQGRGAWEAADSGPAGHILRDRIGKVGTTKIKTKKGKKGKSPKTPGGGGGDGGVEIDPAVQAQLDALGFANDLIGEGNLEALQRYQTGAAQNPILGIPSPSMPTPAPYLTGQEGFDTGRPGVAGVTTNNFKSTGAQHLGKYGYSGGLNTHIHNHTYIDGKEIKTRTRKEIRKSARRGNRPLPSAGGGL